MNILAFDTSLNKTYMALSLGEKVFEKVFETDEKNYHSAYLISGIKEICEGNNFALKDLDLIAVNNGPGSFTGIRVGVTVAKTMAKELETKVLGISSLNILYRAYQNLDPDIILDARREMFYFRTPDETNNKIKLVPYLEISKHITKNALVCDASSFSHLSKLPLPPEIKVINFEEDNLNLSLALLNIAKETVLKAPEADYFWYTLNPCYIQPPPIHKPNP